MKKHSFPRVVVFFGLSLGLILPSVSSIVPSVHAQTSTTKYLNGKITFVSDRDTYQDDGQIQTYLMNPDGTGETRITNHPDTDFYASWSPDGSKIALTRYFATQSEIYVMNPDGSNQVNITNNSVNDEYPIWSHDGSKIAFTSSRDHASGEIYVMNPDGTGVTRLTTNTSADYADSWSPNDAKLSIETNRDGNWEIYTMNADGTGPTRLTNSSSFDSESSWSPDGAKILFSSTRDGNYEVYVMNSDGSSQTNISQNGATDNSSTWSPDGTKVLFMSQRGSDNELYTMNPDGTSQTKVSGIGGTGDDYVAAYSNSWQPLPFTQTANDDGTKTSTISSGKDYSVADYTVANKETLVLDGKLGDVTVPSGGTLSGTGEVTGSLAVNNGGKISPGHSPGCISAGSTTLAGNYTAQLGGSNPCNGYDQLKVNGTLNLSGSSLDVSIIDGFKPAAGQAFTLIENDSTDAVSGTFTDLPEGATFAYNGYVFKVSYVGGTGNDVVLTSLSVPTAPSTGFATLKANPLPGLVGLALLGLAGFAVFRRRLAS